MHNPRFMRLALGLVVLSSLAQGLRTAAAPRAADPAQQNWPQWRGPNGNRVSAATNLPTTWSLTKNVAWKTPLPSWSAGTPIIWGDRIFVTSPVAG